MATTAEQELTKHSVTKEETELLRSQRLFLPIGYGAVAIDLLPDISTYSQPKADLVLYSTIKSERKWWPSSLHTAIAPFASMSWKVTGDIKKRVEQGQELLHTVNGNRGWIEFIQRVLMDYLLTNNGCFIEVVRATSSDVSRIIGLMHLSSLRCRRTGNPDNPVIYTDMLGREHLLKAHQVIFTCDLSIPELSPSADTGMCAAARCYDSIRMMQAIEGFLFGRITGTKTQALDILQNISDKHIMQAIGQTEQEMLARGIIHYKGVTMIASPGQEKVEHTRISFADMPNGFDRQTETKLALMSYALALGLDFQDLYPESVPGGMNTSTQAQKLHEAARGKGLAMFEKWLLWVINEFIMPRATSWQRDERDYRDEQIVAGVSQARTGVVATQIQSGLITPDQGKQILVDLNELPDYVLAADETDNLSLDDTENASSLDASADVDSNEAIEAEADVNGGVVGDMNQDNQDLRAKYFNTPSTATTTKQQSNNGGYVAKLIDSQLSSAEKLYKELKKQEVISKVTLKHLTGKHDQSAHGRRHLSGLSGLVKGGLSRVEAKTKLAKAILADKDSPADKRRAALRALPKQDRAAHYKKPVSKPSKVKPAAAETKLEKPVTPKPDPSVVRLTEINQQISQLKATRKAMGDEIKRAEQTRALLPKRSSNKPGINDQIKKADDHLRALNQTNDKLDMEFSSLNREKSRLVAETIPTGEKYNAGEKKFLEDWAESSIKDIIEDSKLVSDGQDAPANITNPRNKIWAVLNDLKNKQKLYDTPKAVRVSDARIRPEVFQELIDQLEPHAKPYHVIRSSLNGYEPDEDERKDSEAVIEEMNKYAKQNGIDTTYPNSLAETYSTSDLLSARNALRFGRAVEFSRPEDVRSAMASAELDGTNRRISFLQEQQEAIAKKIRAASERSFSPTYGAREHKRALEKLYQEKTLNSKALDRLIEEKSVLEQGLRKEVTTKEFVIATVMGNLARRRNLASVR